jgi:hypothetical protein
LESLARDAARSILTLMSTRLQVVIEEEEARELKRRARAEGLTLSDWVRRVLREAAARRSGPTPAARLDAIDRALRCAHPTADIDEMLAEIERGRALR